jgi:hypothetical protein
VLERCLFTRQGRLVFLVVKTTLISLGGNFSICIIYLGFDQSTKGDLVNYNAQHDQSTKGVNLMNNNSIINRILFAITIFQHSPLTRRVFYNIIRREREGSNINSIWNTDWHIYKSSEVFLIINIIIHSKELEWHHHLHQHGLV